MELTKHNLHDMKPPIDDFLDKEDVEYYKKLKDTLSSHICRNNRNKRVESFNKILITIYYFVNRKKEDDWKRSLICGVCWYKNYICVNIRQMSYLLEKCKSSINGSLKRMFLVVLANKHQSVRILMEAIPYFKNHQDLLHMWSVRHVQIPQTYMYVPLFPVYQFPVVNSFIHQSRAENVEKSENKFNILEPKEKNGISVEVKNEQISNLEQINDDKKQIIDDYYSFFGDSDTADEKIS